MAYFEHLRVRTNFLVFAAFVLAIATLVISVTLFHSKDIRIEIGSNHVHGISVVFFTSLAAWGTALLATIIAASLNRQRDHLAYTWTRPRDRSAIAAETIAVDLGYLIAMFLFIFAVELVCVAIIVQGRIPLVWHNAIPAFLRGFGLALMWYAMVQAATAWAPFRGVVVSAVSWPVFIIVGSLEAVRFPAPWSTVITVLNVFNPMAYLSGTEIQKNGDVVLHSLLPFDDSTRLALVYAISLAALAFAVFSWKRMEA